MNRFIKNILLVLLPTLLFTACKKDSETTTTTGNQSDTYLLDQSTGWQHVMTMECNNKIPSVYDLTSVGQEFAVLYSNVGVFISGAPVHDFYKVKFKDNDAKAPAATKLSISTNDKTIYHCQFIPNTFIPIFTNFEGTGSVGIVDENNTRIGGLVTDRTQTSETINYYYTKDGDFMGGVVLGSHIPFSSQYWTGKYPSVGRMPLIETDKDRGTFKSKIIIPLKLSDGNPYTFTIGEDGTKLKYQVLKLLPLKQRIDPNYEIVDQAEFTGLTASSLESSSPYRSLVAYSFDDDVLTFVLADYKSVSGITQMNKLHCYRWNKRTNSLSTLWESAEVSLTLSKAIQKDVKINGVSPLSYAENRLTPDGTFYTIFTKEIYTEPQPDAEYTILFTVNASGIKELNRTDYIFKNYKKTVRLNNCRYINGAYYALVYPIETEYVKINSPKFHIELVKLNP